MSVQRCPSCGRAWDGSSCFACGHEAGKAVAQASGAASARVEAPATTSPAPAAHQSLPLPSVDSPFTREPTSPQPRAAVAAAPMPSAVATPAFDPRPPYSPTPMAPAAPSAFSAPSTMPGASGGPSFAPLPPLPPLPRSPSGAFSPGPAQGGPGALPRPPSGAFTPRAPPSGPPALPRLDAQGTAPAPVPNLGPPSFGGNATAPSTSATSPPAQLPPSPITFPGEPTTGASRPKGSPGAAPGWPAVSAPRTAPPSSPVAGPAFDHTVEHTADIERPQGHEIVRRVWASPAAFAIVFVVGFASAFGPGAIWKLRTPDLQAMIDAGQAHVVVATLEAREREGALAKGDWVTYGHAIAAAYGTLRRKDMLTKYHTAVQSKRTDATALQNTIDALGDPDTRDRAVDVLALEWPQELAADARLQERTGDENVVLRRAAIDALVARKAPADVVRSVRARVAVADLKTRLCPTAAEGVETIKDLVKEKAVAALRERKVADALFGVSGGGDLVELPCLDPKKVRLLQQEVAALLEGG